jgi:hypothetical protein
VVTPAPTWPTSEKFVQLEPWHRSILNPLSLFELSVQERLILSSATAFAVRLLGAVKVGDDEEVVAVAVFE